MTECQAKVFDSRLGAGPLLTLAAVFAKLKACIEPLGGLHCIVEALHGTTGEQTAIVHVKVRRDPCMEAHQKTPRS